MQLEGLLGTQVQQQNDDFFKAVKMQFDGSNKNIDMITELHPQEIVHLSRIAVLQDWCNNKVPAIDIFVKKFMRMKVSDQRKGRREFFDTWKAAGQEQARNSLLKGLLTKQEERPL